VNKLIFEDVLFMATELFLKSHDIGKYLYQSIMKYDTNLQKPFHSNIILENGNPMIKDFPK
jgi:actin-related protein